MMIRSWSAILIHGEVTCEVIDSPIGCSLIQDEPNIRRPWRFARTDMCWPPEPDDEDFCPCEPGAPCAACTNTARTWWVAVHKRDTEVWFRAIAPEYREKRHCSPVSSSYRLGTVEEAFRYARRRGWVEVLEENGNGKRRALHPVPVLPHVPFEAPSEGPDGQLGMFR